MKIEVGSINYGGNDLEGEFWLGHSCDEWVIGDIEAAKEFLKDLETLIKQVEKKKK